MTTTHKAEQILIETTTALDTPMTTWGEVGGVKQYESEVVFMALEDLIHVLDPFQ